MLLTCVGTGTAAPEPDRACAGFLLELEGARVLLDCGPGVVRSMAKHGVAWPHITHLVVTHFHNDHIGDIPALFMAWKHGLRPARTAPLEVIGPAGTDRLLHRMAELFGGHLEEPGFAVRVRELAPGGRFPLDAGAVLHAGPTRHTDAALAYRVESHGRSFCYTGDTGFAEEVALFARDVDDLLAECSLPDDEAMDSHLTPSRLARLARIAAPKRLLVTHVYPQLDRSAVPELVRRAGWNGPVQMLHDGLRIEL